MRHVEKYPLTAATLPTVPTPVVLGINWYGGFDRPSLQDDGRYWIAQGAPATWGRQRGGHAICVMPPGVKDLTGWWDFYNQGNEGACVGFAASRMMTLLNRMRYDAFALYGKAQEVDEWPGVNYSGTSVRAGMDVLRDLGHWRYQRGGSKLHLRHGIDANRWATSVEDIAACLSPTDNGKSIVDAGHVVLLNSWGRAFPHYTRMPLDALDRLVFRENGEATVITDR